MIARIPPKRWQACNINGTRELIKNSLPGHKLSIRNEVATTISPDQFTTVGTGMIENLARTLELPLLVRSVSRVGAEGKSSSFFLFCPLNLKLEILDVLASFLIISALTVPYLLE